MLTEWGTLWAWPHFLLAGWPVRERERERAGVRSLSPSLSLWPAKRMCAGVLYGVRERNRNGEREREWEREKQGGREKNREGGRKSERDVEYVQNCLFLKGMKGALVPFSYLVFKVDKMMSWLIGLAPKISFILPQIGLPPLSFFLKMIFFVTREQKRI